MYEQIKQVLEPMAAPYEIIFVDDGSQDNTFEIMRDLHTQDPRVHVIHFPINYGKSAALAAGFAAAHGEAIITLDADLQDDPAEIANLLLKLDEGYHLVSGWKKNRHDTFSKRVFSRIFNFVVSRFTHIRLHDFNCGLKAYRREVIEHLHLYGEMHRFIPVIAEWSGFRITEIPVTHHPRRSGKGKYGWERLVRGLLDFITIIFLSHFRHRPAHFFGHVGLWLLAAGLFLSGSGLVTHWLDYLITGSLAFVMGFAMCLLGVLCIFLGLFAEYVTFLFRRNEPSYYISEWLD